MSDTEPGCEITGAHEHRYRRGDQAARIEVQVSGVVIVSEELLDQLLREAGFQPVPHDEEDR